MGRRYDARGYRFTQTGLSEGKKSLAGAGLRGRPDPALAALAAPPALTAREREIVTLASRLGSHRFVPRPDRDRFAGGLSNRQIAERLTVSVRTVEGHLYRACSKLGAGDRTELAARSTVTSTRTEIRVADYSHRLPDRARHQLTRIGL
jgi:DNA-binding CsgD family transcriptional regulator